MRHSARKTNNAVMYGVMGMAVIVLMVVLLFLGWMGKPEPEGQDITDDNTESAAPDSLK